MFNISDKPGAIATVELIDERAGSRAVIAPARGGMLIGLKAQGREWLYLDEATFLDTAQNVRGGNPVLFPTPGKLEGDRWQRAGHEGAMKQHGFARTSAWREVSRSTEGAASVVLELRDSEATRTQFPWSFRTTLGYALQGSMLRIDIHVENTGREPMPYAFGFHPYFQVAQAEKAATRIDTKATRAWDNAAKRETALTGIDLTQKEVDLHLLDHGTSTSALRTPNGTVHLRGSAEFGLWVIWTLAGKDFVCLEPWTAPGNALNTGTNLLELAPGAMRALWLELEVER